MARQTVQLDLDGAIARLTLDRPRALNTLDEAMIEELHKAIADVSRSAEARVLLIRGAGGNFMAGGDLQMFARLADEALQDPEGVATRVSALITRVHGSIVALVDLPIPVIAQVDGACAGFGLSLMLACDLAICAQDSVFTLAYSTVGTTPDGGSTYHLPRLVGERRALELALLGGRIGGVEAERIGLVNRSVAGEELAATVEEWVGRLVAGPTRILGHTKHLLRGSQDASLREQLEREAREFGASVITQEFREGVGAFLDKRPARFHDS